MDERTSRISRNEALYRSLNEQIEGLNADFRTLTDRMTVICECGDASCAEQIDLDVPTYERVRSDPTHFVIRPGHEIADVEDVIEENDEFAVVAKRPGDAARIATELDPRR